MRSLAAYSTVHYLHIRPVAPKYWGINISTKGYLNQGSTALHRRVRLGKHGNVDKMGVDTDDADDQ